MTVKPKQAKIIITILAIMCFLQASIVSRTKSFTWDEPTFVVTGYSNLDNLDFVLNPEAPPLLQFLVALPLKWLDIQAPDYNHPYYHPREQVSFARQFIINNAKKITQITAWSRFPICLLTGLLVILAAQFVWTLLGPVPALFAATLIAFSPNLIAHGSLATTDFGCSILMLTAVANFHAAIQRNNIQNWVILGLITGLALLAKFTALLLFPIFGLLAAYEILFGKLKSIPLLRRSLLAAVVCLFVIAVGYGFHPLLYLHGLSQTYLNVQHDYQFYLFGRVVGDPIWYYHFAALAIKTPTPTLVFLALAIWVVCRVRPNRDVIAYLLLPACVVLLVACFDKANLGLRRVLPAYPFLLSFIAIVVTAYPTSKTTQAGSNK